MSAPTRTLYVYYRVALGQGAELAASFERHRSLLASGDAYLSCRCDRSDRDRRDGVRTWMETYPHVLDAGDGVSRDKKPRDGEARDVDARDVDARYDDARAAQAADVTGRIEAAARTSGLAALAVDGRRHEWFERCA